ncbi:MAG: hypothetical protein VKP57_08840 [Candidatus Sericytochromatia bacterium]|nr:hypothetical protein [Candidatus Sericytochromatia bacterium]
MEGHAVAKRSLGWVLIGVLAGCAGSPGQPSMPGADARPSERRVVVDLSARADAIRSLQAIRHRWVPSDVARFEVILDQRGPDGPGGVPTWLNQASVGVQPALGQSQAVFGNLTGQRAYRLTVQAFTADQQHINSQRPIVVPFDFLGSNDLEDTRVLAVDVPLDDVVFAGQAGLSLTPLDGAFVTDGPVTGGAL